MTDKPNHPPYRDSWLEDLGPEGARDYAASVADPDQVRRFAENNPDTLATPELRQLFKNIKEPRDTET